MSYTIYDLAKDAGVSVSTVSRVLNNSGPVKASTKDRILQLMDKNNYKPNVYARGLNKIGMKTIGIIINDISNPFFAAVINGMESVSRNFKYSLVLCSTGNSPEAEKNELSILLEKQVDGLVLIGSRPHHDVNRSYLLEISEQYPVVLINSTIRGGKLLYSVQIDEYKATYEACQYLIESGYKRLYVLGDPFWQTTHSKLDAIKACLADHGLPFDHEHFISSSYSYQFDEETICNILSSSTERTAFFCCSDMIAIGLHHLLLRKNIQIPEDVGLVGYSNTQLSGLITPPLTTIDQHMHQLGIEAMNTIIGLLNGQPASRKKNIIDHHLVIRETT